MHVNYVTEKTLETKCGDLKNVNKEIKGENVQDKNAIMIHRIINGIYSEQLKPLAQNKAFLTFMLKLLETFIRVTMTAIYYVEDICLDGHNTELLFQS